MPVRRHHPEHIPGITMLPTAVLLIFITTTTTTTSGTINITLVLCDSILKLTTEDSWGETLFQQLVS